MLPGPQTGEPFVMRKTRAFAALVIGIATLSSSTSAVAGRVGPGHHKSWGKDAVSFEQYWSDSTECAQLAADIDLEGTDPAQALVFWTRLGNGDMPPNNYADIWMSARINPEVQWNRAATIMRKQLEGCLIDRGYVKFELTDEQYRRLEALEPGSSERRAYLHSLASDPDILAAQALMEA
jgi:hypothetical protein